MPHFQPDNNKTPQGNQKSFPEYLDKTHREAHQESSLKINQHDNDTPVHYKKGATIKYR